MYLKQNPKLRSSLDPAVLHQLASPKTDDAKLGQQTPRRKNASRETTCMLKAWLNEHRKNPYPTKGEKVMLAIITKMTLTQVSTWFANARRRLKKENKMTWIPRNRSEEDELDDDLEGSLDLDDLDESAEQVFPQPHNYMKRLREASMNQRLSEEESFKKMRVMSLLDNLDTQKQGNHTTDSMLELSSTSSSSPGQLTRSITPPTRTPSEFPKTFLSPISPENLLDTNAASYIKSTFLAISREANAGVSSEESPYWRCLQALAMTAASLANGVEKGHSLEAFVRIPKPLGFCKMMELDRH
ncbi:hypothetical protein Ciccas_011701 [Cichlidogyrus casuarinus]|uniref:Homeobox domain-containing protein n=1 Tax=Cichlidogyrus casuarinus TaxID=1844966 RepID=A0ABD2PQI1_9PLAT